MPEGETPAETDAAKEKTCFVIGPIGDEGTPVRDRADKVLKHVITPPVKECGYAVPVRSDRIAEPGLITRQITKHITDDAVARWVMSFGGECEVLAPEELRAGVRRNRRRRSGA